MPPISCSQVLGLSFVWFEGCVGIRRSLCEMRCWSYDCQRGSMAPGMEHRYGLTFRVPDAEIVLRETDIPP